MNYEFFTLKLAQLRKPLVEELTAFCESVDFLAHDSYFKKGRHPGLDSGNIPLPEVPTSFSEVLETLEPFLPVASLRGFIINTIAPGGHVLEHTDASGSPAYNGNRINGFHVVHVALRGVDVIYKFRRDKALPWTERRMDVGGCYLYNNYAYHETDNLGRDSRINIMLQFADHEWTQKVKIYQAFNVSWNGY